MFHETCRTCGTTFTSRARGRLFCSHPCYAKSVRGEKRSERIKITCKQCGKDFERIPSNVTMYCSHECYLKSDACLFNAEKTDAVKYEKIHPPVEKVTLKCVHCQKDFMVNPGETKRPDGRTPKFCSMPCRRRHFAERFDRFVANPEAIPLPQNYDEFLCQEELPCLVEGCEWIGKHLGIHVNHAHGITAAKFKEIAGFNRNTGLTTLEVFQLRSEISSKQDMSALTESAPCITEVSVLRGKHERRLEAREHQSKAILLNVMEKRGLGLDYRGKQL